MSFIVHHLVWERKPVGTSLMYDGSYPSWDEAIRVALNIIINPEIDPGEIKDDSDPPREEFTGSIPLNEKEMSVTLIQLKGYRIANLSYNHGTFFSVWAEDQSLSPRLFQVRKL